MADHFPPWGLNRWARRAVGPATLIVLCLVPVVLWALALPLGQRFPDLPTSLRSAGVVLGLAGTCSFAINLMLAGRTRVAEAVFGGLDRMYRVHRANGRVAFWLLLSHGMLILAGHAFVSPGAAARLLLPGQGWATTLGAIALVLMATCIGLTLFARINHEVFIYVQRTFGIVFVLASLHVFMTPGTKSISPALTYYLGTMSVAGLMSFAYRSVFSSVLVRRHGYRVVGVRHLDESVTEIRMRPAEREISFLPGQFVFVSFQSEAMDEVLQPVSVAAQGHSAVVTLRPGEVRNQFHPFSIISAPDDPQLALAVKALGDYTNALRHLEEGAAATVEGPYGAFSYERVPNRKQVWIAGGIGVTPFLSMARSLERDGYEIDFYYCMDRRDVGYYLEEFFEIADLHPRFRVIPIRNDELGFISVDDIQGVTKDLTKADVLMCGPPAMMHSLTLNWSTKGCPANASTSRSSVSAGRRGLWASGTAAGGSSLVL